MAGGIIEPGSLVSNGKTEGIYLGFNPQNGNVHVVWSDFGQFSAKQLKQAAAKLP